MDRRAERRALLGADRGDRHAKHVGVHLHQRTVPEQAAGGDELVDGHARLAERLDDHAGAERRGLEQGAVHLLGSGVEGLADDEPGQRCVDQHGTIAVHPVERDETVRTGGLGERQIGEVFVHRHPGRRGGLDVSARHLVVDVPGEDVADARLPRLVAVVPATMPPSTTPHMPGTSTRRSWFIT